MKASAKIKTVLWVVPVCMAASIAASWLVCNGLGIPFDPDRSAAVSGILSASLVAVKASG